MQGSSPVNQTNEDIAPPTDAHMCPFSGKKIMGKVKQEEHLQSRHWVTLSFLPTSSFHEILYRDKTFAKDAPHYSTADACPMFLVDDGNFLDRQSSEDLELGPPQEEWGAGFVNGGLTMFMQKEGGVGKFSILELAPPSPQASNPTDKKSFLQSAITPPTTPKNGLSGLTVDTTPRGRIDSFNSDNSPSTPMTPQQGMGTKRRRNRNRKKRLPPSLPNGQEAKEGGPRQRLTHEDLFINIKMLIHVCRLAGHPHVFSVFRDEELTLGTKYSATGSRMSRRKNRKRLDSNGNLDTSSSIGTIDSLDIDGLQVWDRMGSEVGDDYDTEQPGKHHYENNGAHTPQANGKQLLAAPSGDGLEYEDYTARRKSLGAKAKDEPKKAQAASRVPMNTSPAMSWADRANPYAERKAPTSAEITISGVIIRARLISQEFQEVVDPELKSREAQKQIAKGNDNDGWFKDTKKRIMWVLNVNDHNYNIVLFHSTISGKKSISINGTCLAVKSKALVDFGGQFKFKLGWIKMIISCESRLSGNFKYKVTGGRGGGGWGGVKRNGN